MSAVCRSRFRLLVIGVFLLAVAVGAYYLLKPETIQDKNRKIEVGTEWHEVEAILGSPTGMSSRGYDDELLDPDANFDAPKAALWMHIDDGYAVWIDFDSSGRLTNKELRIFRKGILERLRAWLGL